MQRLKNFILAGVLALVVGLSIAPALSAPALAVDAKGQACQAIDTAGGGGGCGNGTGLKLGNVIRSIINILGIVVGFIAVIMIIVAGLKYVTSGGDASKTASAKSTLIYAIVGIVVAALAQFITRFVLKNVK